MSNNKDFKVKNGIQPTVYHEGLGTVTTGTNTASLDLATGSVFELTPTEDVTVSITNPAASGTVSQATLLLDGVSISTYDLANAVYDNVSYTVTTGPNGLFFKPDGTRVYVIGFSDDAIREYSLSTAWDISTASYVQVFSVATRELFPQGLFFKPDGTKMYVVGSVGDDVNEYDLSTAWDISTATYLQLFSVATQETAPSDLFFKPDGTKMYVLGYTGDDVNEYDLSTAWDVSTATYLQNFSVAAQDTHPNGLFFKPDGTAMYVVGTGNVVDEVNEYALSTAWDVSTASYVQEFSLTMAGPQGLFFKPDGTKMYVIDSSSSAIYQYSTDALATITYDTAITWSGGTAPTSPAIGETDVLTFGTRDGGTTYQGVLAIDGAQ